MIYVFCTGVEELLPQPLLVSRGDNGKNPLRRYKRFVNKNHVLCVDMSRAFLAALAFV